MSISLTSAQRFLCCGVADDSNWHKRELKALWQEIGDEAAFEVAKVNLSASIIAKHLNQIIPRDEASNNWSDAANEIKSRLTLYMFELDRVSQALAEEEIPLIALKNSGIARGIHDDLAGNPMGDIDVLIRPKDFEQAHKILLALGYSLNSRSPLGKKSFEGQKLSGGTEYTYKLSNGEALWFELQWRPVAGRWINESQEPSADELIERSIPIGGSCARLLCPNDNLLQVCLHTAKHSYVRAPGFRLHTDVDRIVRNCRIDWQAFQNTVKSLRVCTAVYFSLWLAKELLHTPIPNDVIKKIQPARWRRTLILRQLLKVGLFNPDEPKWKRPQYILFNVMLYDRLIDLMRSVFPTYAWMINNVGVKTIWKLPFFYLKRTKDLLFNRANT
ncbi:MAG: nucleotidyltransferase family protein [Coxiellaceae bacterium]|nr:nucleotidyltransferase family protein [Coxiellaceae bacterium]